VTWWTGLLRGFICESSSTSFQYGGHCWRSLTVFSWFHWTLQMDEGLWFYKPTFSHSTCGPLVICDTNHNFGRNDNKSMVVVIITWRYSPTWASTSRAIRLHWSLCGSSVTTKYVYGTDHKYGDLSLPEMLQMARGCVWVQTYCVQELRKIHCCNSFSFSGVHRFQRVWIYEKFYDL
jgi:hypothetical protein